VLIGTSQLLNDYPIVFYYKGSSTILMQGVFRDSLISDINHEILDVDAFDVTEKVYSINLSLNYRF